MVGVACRYKVLVAIQRCDDNALTSINAIHGSLRCAVTPFQMCSTTLGGPVCRGQRIMRTCLNPFNRRLRLFGRSGSHIRPQLRWGRHFGGGCASSPSLGLSAGRRGLWGLRPVSLEALCGAREAPGQAKAMDASRSSASARRRAPDKPGAE